MFKRKKIYYGEEKLLVQGYRECQGKPRLPNSLFPSLLETLWTYVCFPIFLMAPYWGFVSANGRLLTFYALEKYVNTGSVTERENAPLPNLFALSRFTLILPLFLSAFPRCLVAWNHFGVNFGIGLQNL